MITMKMRFLFLIVLNLLALNVVRADNVNVVVEVVPPPPVTFATVYPLGALVLGITIPYILIKYGYKFVEMSIFSSPFKSVFKMIGYFLTLIIGTILIYYFLYYLLQPI